MSKRNIVHTSILIIIVALALAACGRTDYSQAIPEVTQSQFLRPPDDIRDYRYCEIIVSAQ